MFDLSTNDVWSGIAGLIVIGGGVLTYIKTFRSPKPVKPAGLALTTIDRAQVERLIGGIERIAEAAEVIVDKRQDHMSATIDAIADLLATRK